MNTGNIMRGLVVAAAAYVLISYAQVVVKGMSAVSVNKGKTVYTLTDYFHSSLLPYRGLVNRLNSAKRGETIRIIIKNHRGGLNHTREYITDAIARSKAKIIVEIRGFAHSNAALLYRHGNTAVVPHRVQILYHQSSINGKQHSRFYSWSYREHILVGAFELMTSAERKAWYDRKDVIISGKRVCDSKFVLTNYKSFCIIKGIKR